MKIGDFVSVIDDDLEGIITSVDGKKVVFKDEHGFTYQFPPEQLVIKEKALYENIHTEIKVEPQKAVSKKHAKNEFKLDLHFDLLVKTPKAYDAFERLFIQKEKLLDTIDFCKKNKIKRLQIIHGIGDGVLQHMVEDTLQSANIEYQLTSILHQQNGAVIVYF